MLFSVVVVWSELPAQVQDEGSNYYPPVARLAQYEFTEGQFFKPLSVVSGTWSTSAGTLNIESFKLRPRPDERFEYEDFGSEIAMSGARIAVTAIGPRPQATLFPKGLAFTYTRNGSSVLALGITSRQGQVTAMGLSNNALLIGAYFDTTTCRWLCERVARIYDDNLFEQ